MDNCTVFNFDFEKMKEICLADIDDFKKYGEVVDTPDGIYIYKNNNSNILAVGHLDFVPKNKFFYHEDDRVFSPQLDDRLGVYTILVELEKRGIVADILLTTNEEKCRSTARYFSTNKNYNWVMEFDRPNDGIAMNFYLDSNIRSKMTKYGFKYESIDRGLYTDIVELKHLGVKCFNFGVGYDLWHTDKCFGDLNILENQLRCVKSFYDDCKNEKLYSSDFSDADKFSYDLNSVESNLNSLIRRSHEAVNNFDEEFYEAEELDMEIRTVLGPIYEDFLTRGYSSNQIHEIVENASKSLMLFHEFRKNSI